MRGQARLGAACQGTVYKTTKAWSGAPRRGGARPGTASTRQGSAGQRLAGFGVAWHGFAKQPGNVAVGRGWAWRC